MSHNTHTHTHAHREKKKEHMVPTIYVSPMLRLLERGNGQMWLKGHWDQQMTTIMSGLLRSTTNTQLAKIQD